MEPGERGEGASRQLQLPTSLTRLLGKPISDLGLLHSTLAVGPAGGAGLAPLSQGQQWMQRSAGPGQPAGHDDSLLQELLVVQRGLLGQQHSQHQQQDVPPQDQVHHQRSYMGQWGQLQGQLQGQRQHPASPTVIKMPSPDSGEEEQDLDVQHTRLMAELRQIQEEVRPAAPKGGAGCT